MKKQRLWNYRGFMIFKPRGNPVDYPYRIGDTNYTSLEEAKREIDRTWTEVEEDVKQKCGGK